MFINKMDFPNQILDALKNNTLVVFCGAGISMGEPTNLPNFEELTKKLAKGTEYKRKSQESCESFLGTMKQNGMNINELSSKILSDPDLKHNGYHETIINLFSSPSNIKIVTTNFDNMFEQVLDEKGIHCEIYNAPALPFGNDVSGIVHIHGNVNNPKYMVITDDDFGEAYLTNGYASRFLVELFESYTVLFVGYSYNDTILKYLTRAMTRKQAQKRYIITDDKKFIWGSYGIIPIYYPKGNYPAIYDGLNIIANRVKTSLTEWKEHLKEFCDKPPNDLTSRSEIEYCLEDTERTQILANTITGEKWVKVLDEKGLFDNLFQNEIAVTRNDDIWMKWLCQKIVIKEDDAFRMLLSKHGSTLNNRFANMLIKTIIDTMDPSSYVYKEYLILLCGYINDEHTISLLIEKAIKIESFSICENLYKKLWTIQYYFDDESLFDSKKVLKLSFLGKHHNIEKSWNQIKTLIDKENAKKFLIFFKTKLDELYNKVIPDGKSEEPFEYLLLDIESKDDGFLKNELNCLVDQMEELSKNIEGKDPCFLKKYLFDGINETKSNLQKRIFLKLIRVTNVFSDNESFKLLNETGLLSSTICKEQVFLLIKKIYKGLSEENVNCLIDYIESINKVDEYEKYNWCIWIKQICDTNNRINNLMEDILSRNEYEPREYPEKNFYISKTEWNSLISPINYNELLSMPCGEAIDYINKYQEKGIRGPSREGLLDVFSTIISKNIKWAKRVASIFKGRGQIADDVIEHYFNGLDSCSFSIDDSIQLIDELSLLEGFNNYTRRIAYFVFSVVKKEEFKEKSENYREEIWKVITRLWEKRETKEMESEDISLLTFNTADGLLLHTLFYLISYSKDNGIHNKYKEFMESTLLLENKTRDIATYMLAGHFNFFYYRDASWCIKQLTPLLKWKNNNSFVAAWGGMAAFYSGVNQDTEDVMSDVVCRAIKHISLLKSGARKTLIDLYLTIMIYVINDPIKKYVPLFYKYANEDDRVYFLNSISRRLKNMDDEPQIRWWNSWLKDFLTNLINNKPDVSSDKEIERIINWIIGAKSIYGDLIDIVIKFKVPERIDSLFFYELKENKEYITQANKTALLLTTLLDSNLDTSHSKSDIASIAKEIINIGIDDIDGINEVLLGRNIEINKINSCFICN